MYTCMHVYVHIYIVHMYICVYVYILFSTAVLLKASQGTWPASPSDVDDSPNNSTSNNASNTMISNDDNNDNSNNDSDTHSIMIVIIFALITFRRGRFLRSRRPSKRETQHTCIYIYICMCA